MKSAIRPVLAMLFLAMTARGAEVAGGIEAQFDAANKFYAQNNFAAAGQTYQQILDTGITSAALQFNLGNACFKSSQMGRAIAAYREAQQLAPRDPDIRANLQFARNQVRGPRHLPGKIESGLLILSRSEWLVLTTILVWLTLGLLIARQLRPAWTPHLRSWTWLTGAAATAVLLATISAHRFADPKREAIVIVPDATVRLGPFDESPSAFTAHDGAELAVLDQKGDWLQVSDRGRNLGWIKREAVLF